jgi:Methyltransferase domain
MSWRQRIRRLVRPPGELFDNKADEPVSRAFGFDRGQPIDRHYIDLFLSQHHELISGNVLEVAGNEYTTRYGGSRARSFELYKTSVERPGVVVGDLTQPQTLPAARFDCFVCTQTFNFIYDIHAAVRGAAHVLADGGHLLATVGAVSQISRYDMDRWGDYWRLSTAACERLFAENFSSVQVSAFGNLAAAVALLRGFAVEDLPSPSVLDRHDPDYPLIIGIVARKG